MSYARFSSDDFRSDVYVYAADDGCTVMLATNKVTMNRSSLPEITAEIKDPEWVGQWTARHKALSHLLNHESRISAFETEEMRKLAGSIHTGLSAQQTYDLLKELEETGFYVPAGTAEAVLNDGDDDEEDS